MQWLRSDVVEVLAIEDDFATGMAPAVPDQAAFEAEWATEQHRYIGLLKAKVQPLVGSFQEQMNIDPLAWWQTIKHQVPMLAKCAAKLFAIPAQSAASERFFSALTYIVNKHRCGLQVNRAAALVLS